MRAISIPITLLAAVVAWPAAARVSTPAEQNAPPPSVLVPRMPESLPAPTPIVPESNAQPVAPQGFAPMQATPTQNPSPPADVGTVTAVPLPPPGTEPSPVPSPVPSLAPRGPSDTATAASPANIGAPISLAPPRPQPPPPGVEFTKLPAPGAKIPAAALVANKLPTPALSSEASPVDFLRAARGALAAGRDGEARSALEMAQTRLLDRVVEAGKEQEPSNNAAVKQISEAISALVANDRLACLRYIEFASQTLGSPLD
jgi:hypothetical protein